MIIIDEYAELADDAPDTMSDTDTIARLGRAPAVTLVAATQRPTQKVMGQAAVRSQMNIRISFRVEEQRDVDLILGQGKAGWHAHKLNAPGKFLISAPEHDSPDAPAPTSSPTTTSRTRSPATQPPAPTRQHLPPRANRRAVGSVATLRRTRPRAPARQAR